MRSYSIFHDEKLLLSLPNTLETNKKITDSRLTLRSKSVIFPKNVTCSVTVGYKKPPRKIYNHLPKSTENSRVSLIFTSLEVENIYSAFHLFNLFLSNYINKLLKNKFLKLTSLTGDLGQNTNSRQDKLSLWAKAYEIGYDSAKCVPTTKPQGQKGQVNGTQFTKQNKKLGLLSINIQVGEDYKLRYLALKAVRNLAGGVLALGVPQKTNLYTVIRSPHVFKKTREQFVKQKYKRIIQLDFASSTLSSEFLDALVLLKLPVEIKVVVHSSL